LNGYVRAQEAAAATVSATGRSVAQRLECERFSAALDGG